MKKFIITAIFSDTEFDCKGETVDCWFIFIGKGRTLTLKNYVTLALKVGHFYNNGKLMVK